MTPVAIRTLRGLLPGLSLAILIAAIAWRNPMTMSYMGFNLLLNLAIPLALATLAQMCVIAVNDIDLSLGAYVGFVACVSATMLDGGLAAVPALGIDATTAAGSALLRSPIAGIVALAAGVAIYAALGALIHLRNLPSIVVTLGMSFVWLGLSILILPQPGGKAPLWLKDVMALRLPVVPLPIVAAVIIAIAAQFLFMRTSFGVVLRGAGGNARAVERAGWSLLRVKVTMFALCGVFGMLAGLALVGLTTSGDANIALRYTLLSIAGVILGGGEFVGGRISPVGAVLGALTLTLAGSFLSFLNIRPEWQIGAQGAILIIVLALRAAIERLERRP